MSSSGDEFPLLEVQPLCPQCGAKLLIEDDGVDPKPQDRVFCPTHGTVGTREEISAQVLKQNRDKIEQHAKEFLRKSFKGGGFNIE